MINVLNNLFNPAAIDGVGVTHNEGYRDLTGWAMFKVYLRGGQTIDVSLSNTLTSDQWKDMTASQEAIKRHWTKVESARQRFLQEVEASQNSRTRKAIR